ncbi:MAG: flavodoxin [Anaerolineaceae bacterium]|jgi:flavodoxin
MNSNVLIAYFSRAGENYRNGKLVTLTVGNTEIAARKIAAMTGADLFKIDPLHQYSKNYRVCTEEAKQELQSNARPGLKQYLDSIDSFNTIILAYPNWWNTMPMPVWTFLEHYDFSGKVILPLCTHEGSAMGRSLSDIRKLCPRAELKPGLAIRGGEVEQADKRIRDWLEDAGLI